MNHNRIIDEDGWVHEEVANDTGVIIEKIDKRPDGTISCRIVYAYSQTGNCTGWVVDDGKGKVIRTFQISLNKENETILIERDGANVFLRSCPWPVLN